MTVEQWNKLILIGGSAAIIAFLAASCRSKTISEFEFKSGEIARATYTQETGFHFFSDGVGKTLSPSLTISGINF